MSERVTPPCANSSNLEAKMRADPLTRGGRRAHILPQDRAWVAGSRTKDEEWAKAGFRYWPRLLTLTTLIVCFFILVFVVGVGIGLRSQ